MFEENVIRALVLSLLAGLSTLLGAMIIFFYKGKSNKLISASLGFAAGVMLSVSFSDLYPHAQNLLTGYAGKTAGVLLSIGFLILGICLALFIDRFVPHEKYDEKTGDRPHADLFRLGFISMIAIGLHNFPEGIATFIAAYKDSSLGITVAIAIALHNIPEGLAVAMPIYYATGKKGKALKYCALSGFAEPAGALASFLILRPFINDVLLGAIFAFVAGIMIYISIEELIPSSRQYGHDRLAVFSTIAGICTMLLTHLF